MLELGVHFPQYMRAAKGMARARVEPMSTTALLIVITFVSVSPSKPGQTLDFSLHAGGSFYPDDDNELAEVAVAGGWKLSETISLQSSLLLSRGEATLPALRFGVGFDWEWFGALAGVSLQPPTHVHD